MKKTLILFLSIIISSTISMTAWSVIIDGVEIEKSLSVDKINMQLKGAGKREMDIGKYVLQLFLSKDSKDAKTIINTDEPMAFLCNITAINAGSTMRDLIQGGVQEEYITEEFQATLDGICHAFPGEIQKGDKFLMSYTSKKGTEIHKNDTFCQAIPCLDFKKALFGVWLGDNPVDPDLKEALLTNNPYKK